MHQTSFHVSQAKLLWLLQVVACAITIAGGVPIPLAGSFAVDGLVENVECDDADVCTLWMRRTGDGVKIVSPDIYHYGVYTAQLKWAAEDTSGIVGTFYLSSGEPGQDEIDFEFFGAKKTAVQTNWFSNGKGADENERVARLPFDASADFHAYKIVWTPTSVMWYVDGTLVRTLLNNGTAFPIKPSRIYFSLWDATMICGGCWAGFANGAAAPWAYQFKGLDYTPFPAA